MTDVAVPVPGRRADVLARNALPTARVTRRPAHVDLRQVIVPPTRRVEPPLTRAG